MKREIIDATRFIRERIETVKQANLEIAQKLLEAKALFETVIDWLAWTEKEFGYSRRWSFGLVRSAEWWSRITPDQRAKSASAALDVTRIEIMAKIPPERFGQFLKKVEPKKLNRDELRDAVNDFLGNDRQPSFLIYRRLPKPEQLLLGLDRVENVRKIDPIAEYNFAAAHMKRLNLALDRLDPETVDEIRRALIEQAEYIEARLNLPEK